MMQSPPVLFVAWLLSVVCSLIANVRELAVWVVGTFISCTAFAGSIKAFKQRQANAKKRGTEIILRIQAYRTPFLDKYFVFGSFFGEEDFYLVLIPALLWNVDRDCARGLTWVVCSGIMIGNYIKDVFLVPRPPSPPVWVPHKTASTDSTALRDYGFPSTHSVNGVTNPTYFIMYLWRAGYISVNNPYWMAVILVCGLVWLGSLSFGRMYLGVHSPSDVEGGVVIGASIMLVTYLYGTEIDSWIVANEYALPLLFLGLVTFLLLSPQPRPRNPTFIQNCLLAGLIMGAAIGSQLHHHQVGIVDGHWDFAFAPSWARFAGPITPVLGVLIRQVFGFSLVLTLRAIIKQILSTIVRVVFGVRLGKAKGNEDVDEDLVIGLEATTKFFSYSVLSWSLMHGVPVLIANLNMDVM